MFEQFRIEILRVNILEIAPVFTILSLTKIMINLYKHSENGHVFCSLLSFNMLHIMGYLKKMWLFPNRTYRVRLGDTEIHNLFNSSLEID